MSLEPALRAMDPERASAAMDSATEKIAGSFAQADEMFEVMLVEYPSFEVILRSLVDKSHEDDEINEETTEIMFVGATWVLYALREYAKAEELRSRFPDMPRESN